MDLSALISRFRNLSGDHGVPPLFADADVIGYLNEAEREAAERARLLFDKDTPELVRIDLLPDVRRYRLHAKVFDVEAAFLERAGATNGQRKRLCRAAKADMDWTSSYRPNLSGWADAFHVVGQATGEGFDGMWLERDRKPTEAGGALYLHVYRYPLADMEVSIDEPEIAPRHHDALPHWALCVAYKTRDMEAGAAARAERHEAEFERRFGVRDDANVMRKKVRHRAPVTRPIRF